ncbi:RNA-directed DNA polymerase from mobile element jockey [Trichonephila clavipes]|nr:RNA-directed DNA polymerase from mobile element jockey [Trichonephila clavipes]
MQNFLDRLQDWLTQWRIAINVNRSQAIIFRKWGVIDPPFQLTLFDDNIQWVSVVRYLGLPMDSRLTYKKHIDYLSDKFWGRIHLAISLIGRNSPLSLENKVILYKQVLRPIITYASPVWGAAAATHMKKIQIIQNKILRLMTNAPCRILKKWASVISLLKEDETVQAIEEPDEIMHINRDSESKYDKSDRHETFELNCNFQMLPKELYQEN